MIRVFVSSTRKDMDEDCRPIVLSAFELLNAESPVAVVPINMDDWAAEYRPAVEVCEANVGGSTHYIGIFGYYRGWVPPERDVSITEMELEWARSGQKPVAVFLPHLAQPDPSFARVMEERARPHQDEAALAAQRAFLARVSSEGTVEFVKDAAQLGIRTYRRLQLWAAPPAQQTPASPARRDERPHQSHLLRLGRIDQVGAFERGLQRLAAAGVGGAACFLVHGRAGFGHDVLVERLKEMLNGQAYEEPHWCVVGCGPMWRQRGLSSMLRALGKELQTAREPASLAELASELESRLATSDVGLLVSRLQHYEGGVAGFAAGFWQPLLAELSGTARFRLLCVATHEGASADAGEWRPYLQDEAGATPDMSRPIALPALTEITRGELMAFLRAYLPPEDLAPMADGLLEDTGGTPHLLYHRLLDDSFWQT
jgi:hypothetical protein